MITSAPSSSTQRRAASSSFGKTSSSLPASRFLLSGLHADRPDRSAFLPQAQFAEGLGVKRLPAIPHDEDREFLAEHQCGQHRMSTGPDHRNVQHRAQSRHSGIAHGVDADRIKSIPLRIQSCIKNGEVRQGEIMLAGIVRGPNANRPEVELHIGSELYGFQLILATTELVFAHREGNYHQNPFHVVLPISCRSVRNALRSAAPPKVRRDVRAPSPRAGRCRTCNPRTRAPRGHAPRRLRQTRSAAACRPVAAHAPAHR